jgi:hypothetical protein
MRAAEEPVAFSAIDALSRRYLDVPFVDNATGDGPGSGVDERSMLRRDAFDCITYVETVLAEHLALVLGNPLENVLRALRYGNAPPSFARRHHFARHDWVPNAMSFGFIHDVTDSTLASIPLRRREWSYEPEGWLNRTARSRFQSADATALKRVAEEAKGLPTRRVSFRVAPLSQFRPAPRGEPEPQATKALEAIEDEHLVLFVGSRGEHLGWLIPRRTGAVLRHASRERRVVREDHLLRFIRVHESFGYLDGLVVFRVTGAKT